MILLQIFFTSALCSSSRLPIFLPVSPTLAKLHFLQGVFVDDIEGVGDPVYLDRYNSLCLRLLLYDVSRVFSNDTFFCILS